MIRAFFGLTRNPFDLRDLKLLPGQQEILDTLKVHCQQGGLCLVLGVPGTGKSVVKQALQRLPENQHLVATRTLHTYSVIVKRLGPDALRDFLLRELDRAVLGHNTFTQPALDLVVRSADGVLRRARNLCVGCLVEAVRSASRTIDLDHVNRVLMQPHWQKDADLVDF